MKHDYTPQRQDWFACLQASISILLSSYHIHKTPREIQQDLPVYTNEQGNVLGTSVGHAALYLQSLGFQVEIFTSDLGLWDFNWQDLDNAQLMAALEKRLPHLVHHTYSESEFEVIVDGYRQFLAHHGTLKIVPLTSHQLIHWLKYGPVLAGINFQYLHQMPKLKRIEAHNTVVPDPYSSYPNTHVVVIVGRSKDKFLIADSGNQHAEELEIAKDHLIGAIVAAACDFNSLVIRIIPKS